MIHATLSVRLKALEEKGLVTRKQYETIPPAVEYSLTDIGAKFHPAMEALQKWGEEYRVHERKRGNKMKIAVFNGSPRKQNTYAMVQAFKEGAEAGGHEVDIYDVAKMKIGGCLGCEYCHTKGEGSCVQKDDFEKLLPAYTEADMIVFASPIYYFTMSAQIEAAIQRVYCIGKPAKATKVALLLSSGSPGVYDSAVAQFKGYCGYTGIELAGVITANGEENKSEVKLNEVREFAKAL